MNNFEKWSEYQEYIKPNTIEIEEQYGNELYLYSCFCTLTWKNSKFLVLRDNILIQTSEGYGEIYNEFEIVKDTLTILEIGIE